MIRKINPNANKNLLEGMTEEEQIHFDSLETDAEKISYALDLLGFKL